MESDSSNDSSDEDYVPYQSKDACPRSSPIIHLLSEHNDSTSNSENESSHCKRKRIHTKCDNNFIKRRVGAIDNRSTVSNKDDLKDKKKQQDDVWNEFMRDTGFQSKSCLVDSKYKLSSASASTSSQTLRSNCTESIASCSDIDQPTLDIQASQDNISGCQKKSNDFKQCSDTKQVNSNFKQLQEQKSKGKSNISSMLHCTSEKSKLSTLEKSRLDWSEFTKETRIETDLDRHRRGKYAYLDRQAFLERTDLRQFEIEKKSRAIERSKRNIK